MGKVFSDFETEQRLALGFGCKNQSNAETFLQLLQVKDFINPIYQEVYEALEKASENFFDVTPLNIAEYLDEIVGTDHEINKYIKEFEDSDETIESVSRTLRDMRLRKHIKVLATKLDNEVFESTTSGFQLIARLKNAVEVLEQKAGLVAFKHTTQNEIVSNADTYLDLVKQGKQVGIPTGVKNFDNNLRWGGFALGELSVIGAVRSVGKTALALQTFYECGVADIPAIYINLESTNESLFYRISLRFTDGALLNYENSQNLDYIKKLNTFRQWFKSKSLFFESRIKDINDLNVYVKNMVAIHGIKAVIVDYGNKLRNAKASREQRYRQMTITYEVLQEIAIDHNIAVIALNQLTQKAENEDYEPTLADFKESGGVTDVADTVIMIWGGRQALDISCKIGKQKNYRISNKMFLRFDRQKQIMQNGMNVNLEQNTAF